MYTNPKIDPRPTAGGRFTVNEPGDLVVWYYSQLGSGVPAFMVRVPDLATGAIVVNTLAAFSLHEYENNVKPDYADAVGIARWEDDGDNGHEWFDVDEEEVENA